MRACSVAYHQLGYRVGGYACFGSHGGDTGHCHIRHEANHIVDLVGIRDKVPVKRNLRQIVLKTNQPYLLQIDLLLRSTANIQPECGQRAGIIRCFEEFYCIGMIFPVIGNGEGATLFCGKRIVTAGDKEKIGRGGRIGTQRDQRDRIPVRIVGQFLKDDVWVECTLDGKRQASVRVFPDIGDIFTGSGKPTDINRCFLRQITADTAEGLIQNMDIVIVEALVVQVDATAGYRGVVRLPVFHPDEGIHCVGQVYGTRRGSQ